MHSSSTMDEKRRNKLDKPLEKSYGISEGCGFESRLGTQKFF